MLHNISYYMSINMYENNFQYTWQIYLNLLQKRFSDKADFSIISIALVV